MRADADDLARVRDPTIELLLGHTGSLTDGVQPRAGRRQLGSHIARTDRQRS
jgi:hypothetical protein